MKLSELEGAFERIEKRWEPRTFLKDASSCAAEGHEHTDGCFETREGWVPYYVDVGTLDQAQGVRFLCPKCFRTNGGPIGTHLILAWFADRDVADDVGPGAVIAPETDPRYPGGRAAQRWRPSGMGLGDLTLTPSIDSDHGHWHGFVENGGIRDA